MLLAGAGSGVRRHGAGAARRFDLGRRERRRNRLGPAEDDALARLRTGAATSLVPLTATALGLASCPVTEPLEIADARAAVREDVFGGNEFPRCRCGSAGRRSTLIRYSRPRHALVKLSNSSTARRFTEAAQ